jgi:hypothetical protein
MVALFIHLRLVFDQVLPPLDRPHPPVRRRGHDPVGERNEVAAAGEGVGTPLIAPKAGIINLLSVGAAYGVVASPESEVLR